MGLVIRVPDIATNQISTSATICWLIVKLTSYSHKHHLFPCEINGNHSPEWPVVTNCPYLCLLLTVNPIIGELLNCQQFYGFAPASHFVQL